MIREKRSAGAVDHSRDDTVRSEARAWAESHAVSESEALFRVTGSGELLHLAAECGDEVEVGVLQQGSCPVKMGSGADYDLLYTLAERTRCTRIVETGVAFGWSSFALLHSVAKRKGRLISTDMPYPLRENDAFVGCVVPQQLRPFWTLLRAPTGMRCRLL